MLQSHWFHADKAGDVLGLDYRDGLHKPVTEFGDFPLVIYYGGWTLKDLYECRKIRPFLHPPFGFSFYEVPAEAGYYALRFSELLTRQTWDQQLSKPPIDGWELSPTVIATVGTLLVLMDTSDSFLGGKHGSCVEDISHGGHRPALTIERNVLYIQTTAQAHFDGTTFPMLGRIQCKKIG